MSQIEVEHFLGRILTDSNFRAEAASSLTSACSSEGIALSPEEFSYLCNINYLMFSHLAETLDDAIRRKYEYQHILVFPIETGKECIHATRRG